MKARDYMEEALFQLIDRKAYDKISVTDIVKRAGVTRVTFYRNFESKDQILKQALERSFQTFQDKAGDGQALSDIFRFFEGNKLLIDRLFKSQKEIFIAQLFTERESLKLVPAQVAYSLATVGFTILGLCTAWYERGMLETAEEIEKLRFPK